MSAAKTHPRSGITNDPNRPADPQYILRLLAKVISVSLETVTIVDRGLAGLSVCKTLTTVSAELEVGSLAITRHHNQDG